jgi:hypothetical protein
VLYTVLSSRRETIENLKSRWLVVARECSNVKLPHSLLSSRRTVGVDEHNLDEIDTCII